ncbi:MAG TPA: universal stress protein [Actinomycetota bacterium]|nr:universal stress protein [Actinomycetota bacterium]
MAYSKIICGVDGSDTSMLALAEASKLAASEGAELTVLYALREDMEHAATAATGDEVLERAQKAAREEGVEPNARLEQGDPSEVLIDVAEKVGADLLVVGNKGMTGVQRFLLGSVPNKVSHHAPCDLLIVKTT